MALILILKQKIVLSLALVSFASSSLLKLNPNSATSPFAAAWSSTSQHGKVPSLQHMQIKQPPGTTTATRRNVLHSIQIAVLPSILLSKTAIAADTCSTKDSNQLAIQSRQNYRYNEAWTGTSLQILSPVDAAVVASSAERFPFALWPDPILRRPASVVTVPSSLSRSELHMIAQVLRQTARYYGAVGLAAQQCGIDVSLVYLDTSASTYTHALEYSAPWKRENKLYPSKSKDRDVSSDEDGIFLVNPRIVARSPEQDMKVWTEHCLVLPPTFDATVLRDDSITIAYERLKDGKASFITLNGELARAAQHEMDHDRGILILDHVGLEDMESDKMRLLETDGHDDRQVLAFERSVALSTLYATTAHNWLQPPPANADGDDFHQQQPKATDCDEDCIAKRRKVIAERRAMMMQARTTTNRQDMFDLSRQRATLYNVTYQGASCAPGVPCL